MDPFENSVRTGRLKVVETDTAAIHKGIEAAQEELLTARSSHGSGHFGDAITHAYFAMSRSAKSLLLAAGYRNTNLYSLTAGLDHLYVSKGTLDPELIELLKIAKDQKDLILQGAQGGRGDAGVLLAAAERLTACASDIIGVPGPKAPRHSPDSDHAYLQDVQQGSPSPESRRRRRRDPRDHARDSHYRPARVSTARTASGSIDRPGGSDLHSSLPPLDHRDEM